MPKPPGGFRAEMYPLRHRFLYGFGLSMATANQNSAWITLVRSAGKPTVETNPNTTIVNPHNTDVDMETGPACTGMSIIDNLKIVMSFTKSRTNDEKMPIKFTWTPFFCAFEQKYDAADFDTGETVASIMELTKDATVEDVVPLTATKTPSEGVSDLGQPASTVNLAEVFGTYNMTTDLLFEGTAFDNDQFHRILTFGTNKGALKACLGRTRHVSLTMNNGIHNVFIRKFVPRQIRRIVPFTYFGILVHVPLGNEAGQFYHSAAVTGAKTHIGVKCLVTYDEWHPDHDQEMT